MYRSQANNVVNKAKSLFFQNKNKMDMLLARLLKR